MFNKKNLGFLSVSLSGTNSGTGTGEWVGSCGVDLGKMIFKFT